MRLPLGLLWPLAVITALGFWLRLDGLDRLQPYLHESDAFLVMQMQLHREGIGAVQDLPVRYGAYPTLIARVLACIPEAGVAAHTPPGEQLAAHLQAASSDYVRVRTLVALLSSLLVPATFVLARRFLSSGAALLAAALSATCLLHLLFSQEARPHGVHASLALCTVLCALALQRRPTWGAYALCTALVGLTIGSLQTGVFVLLPVASAHVLRARGESRRAGPWAAVLPLVAAVLATGLLYPRLPNLTDDGRVLEFGGHTLRMAKLDGSGLGMLADFLRSSDPVLLYGACGGLLVAVVRMARRRGAPELDSRADLFIVASYAVPYGAALCVFGELQDRLIVPLVPYLALLTALLVDACTPRAGSLRIVLGGLLGLGVLSYPTRVVLRFTAMHHTPDTIEQAADWVATHTQPHEDRIVLTSRLTLPLFSDPESLRAAAADSATRRLVWMDWQLRHLGLEEGLDPRPAFKLFPAPGTLLQTSDEAAAQHVRAWLDALQPDYAVLEVSYLTSYFAALRSLQEEVRARGRLVASFRGEAADLCLEFPIQYQEIPHFARRVLAADAFGPCLEIYRLDR